jgi:subtilisin family serine protease
MRPAVSLLAIASFLLLAACAQEQADFYSPPNEECTTNAIAGEYMLKLRDSRELQKLKLSRPQVQKLLTDRKVEWIEPNYHVHAQSLPPFMTGGLSNPNAIIIGANYAWQKGLRGQGMTVAVVDSGIDNRHPLLEGKVIDGYNFIDDTPNFRDETGHGTHIAGIIAGSRSENFSGIAPKAKLIAADFMNEDRGDEFNAIKAVDYSIQKGARIINDSWSNMCSYSLRSAFEGWSGENVIFVNAAGNDAERIDSLAIYPANLMLGNGVTVGSIDNDGRRSSFSNYGRNVVIYAPGQDIFSLSTMDYGVGYFVPRSGTSMATAFVSGALALAWGSAPDTPAVKIVDLIRNDTTAQHANASPIISVERLIRKLH